MKADLKLINWLMNQSGVSKYSISQATGVPQTTLSDIAKGKTEPDKMTFGTASKLTAYAIQVQDERRGLNVLWYNDNGKYHKIYEVISDRTMSVDQLLEFSELTLERIAELLDFEAIDYEHLTTVKGQ